MTGSPAPQDATVDKPIDWLPWALWAPFVVIIGLVAFWMAGKTTPPATVAVPISTLPPYHLITMQDLTTKTIDAALLAPDDLYEATMLINQYTLAPLITGELVKKTQVRPVSDTQLLSQTVAIGIPATSAMALNGNLQAGQVVDIILVPTRGAAQPATSQTYANILVLDVRQVEPPPAKENTAPRYTLVIAMPLDKREAFAVDFSHAATTLITQKTSP